MTCSMHVCWLHDHTLRILLSGSLEKVTNIRCFLRLHPTQRSQHTQQQHCRHTHVRTATWTGGMQSSSHVYSRSYISTVHYNVVLTMMCVVVRWDVSGSAQLSLASSACSSQCGTLGPSHAASIHCYEITLNSHRCLGHDKYVFVIVVTLSSNPMPSASCSMVRPVCAPLDDSPAADTEDGGASTIGEWGASLHHDIIAHE